LQQPIPACGRLIAPNKLRFELLGGGRDRRRALAALPPIDRYLEGWCAFHGYSHHKRPRLPAGNIENVIRLQNHVGRSQMQYPRQIQWNLFTHLRFVTAAVPAINKRLLGGESQGSLRPRQRGRGCCCDCSCPASGRSNIKTRAISLMPVGSPA